MDIKDILDNILKANSIKQIVDVSDYDNSCKSIIKKIHPDICQLPQANNAFVRFMELKKVFENGIMFVDDSGEVFIKQNVIEFKGDMTLVNKSKLNYDKIYSMANDNFKKYLPDKFEDNKIYFNEHLVSLNDIVLEEVHGRWVMSRLLEFSAYMESIGVSHMGINLDSFLINPETHGIKVISFYHCRPINSKIETISGKYHTLYPPSVFNDKIALSKIDAELSKRVVCMILGDKSGLGVKLKKSLTTPLYNFLLKFGGNSIDSFIEWKGLINANYESKFYELKL